MHIASIIRPRDVEADVEAGSSESGSGSAKISLRFHIGGKNEGRKEIGFDILWRRAKRESINIKK